MSTSIAIDSISNAMNGTGATVVITGTPSGAVQFKASRMPNYSTAVGVSSFGTGPYTVTLPNPGLWYVWAFDSSGVVAEPGAVWASSSNISELEAVGLKIRDILRDNKKGIEAILRTVYPDSTLKCIHYGSAVLVDDFPAILVRDPRDDVEWAFFPYGEIHTYRFTIFCLVIHPDEQTEMDFATQFGEAVKFILRQPHYVTITLDSGVVIDNCQVSDIRVDDTDLGGDAAHGAVASLSWSGVAIKQHTEGA
jgi:hypothetical protein